MNEREPSTELEEHDGGSYPEETEIPSEDDLESELPGVPDLDDSERASR